VRSVVSGESISLSLKERAFEFGNSAEDEQGDKSPVMSL